MGAFILLFLIVGYLCLVPSRSCPATCRCVTKAQPLADCSYRELTHVPEGFPENTHHLTLSVNNISGLNRTSFASILKLTSLYLTYNMITSIDTGTFQFLTSLINLDLSHNQLSEFPWMDLLTLGDLQILNLNNNQLATIPFGVFNNSKSLRSLQVSNNQLYSLPEGLFDPLTSLSHVQLHKNSFHCTCSLAWLIDWIQRTLITIDRKREIICLSPKDLMDIALDKVPDLQCRKPLEVVSDDPNWGNTLLLCKEVEVPYVMIKKDRDEQKNYNDIQVTVRKFKNGSVTVTSIKQGTAYLCRVSNHTTENTGEISVSLTRHQIPDWQIVTEEKLLLLLVSGHTNAGSSVMAIPMLFWQAVFMVLCHKVS